MFTCTLTEALGGHRLSTAAQLTRMQLCVPLDGLGLLWVEARARAGVQEKVSWHRHLEVLHGQTQSSDKQGHAHHAQKDPEQKQHRLEGADDEDQDPSRRHQQHAHAQQRAVMGRHARRLRCLQLQMLQMQTGGRSQQTPGTLGRATRKARVRARAVSRCHERRPLLPLRKSQRAAAVTIAPVRADPLELHV